jgi:hypothetical protein
LWPGLLRLGLGLALLLLEEVAIGPVARGTRTNVSENRFLDLGRLIGKQLQGRVGRTSFACRIREILCEMLFAKTQEILVGGRTRFGFLRFDPGTWQGEFLIIPPGFVFSAFFARGQELY